VSRPFKRKDPDKLMKLTTEANELLEGREDRFLQECELTKQPAA